jgi:hypothetical protein
MIGNYKINQEVSRFPLPCMLKEKKINCWTISQVRGDKNLLTNCCYREGTKEAATKLDWTIL